MTQDKEKLAQAEVEVMESKKKVALLHEELQKANTKLNVYDKAGLLKLPDKDPSFLQPRVAAPSPREFEKLREAHSELQLLYREKSRELEQLSLTLSSHSSTYQALQAQVAKVTKESEEKENHLNMTIKSLGDTIRRRDERCDKLEGQILSLTNRGIIDKVEEPGSCLTQTVGLGKHDNVLEFHIDQIVFELPDFTRLKTFVSWTVPFSLEDPLQHTNVARGTEAHYNYSALYKFQVNSRNLSSLKEDTVTVSVYILLDSSHPAKVGECSLTFQEVLNHPRNTLHGTVPVVFAHDAEEAQHLTFTAHIQPGQVIGSMSYWFRLQRPCEDAIAQYLHTSGMLLARQKEKSVPKEFRVTEPTASVTQKSVVHEVIKQPENMPMPKKGDDDLHREMFSTPEQKHPPLSPHKKRASEKTDSSEKPLEETLDHTPPESAPHSESDHVVVTDPRTYPKTRSRSSSVSSTGTYNVESSKKSTAHNHSDLDAPRNMKKRVSSESSSAGSSRGTYSVESPKISKTGKSITDEPKILKSKGPKRSNSESASVSYSSRSSRDKPSPSMSYRRSAFSKSSASTKKKVKSDVSEEGPSTSYSTPALPLQPPQKGSYRLSRSQSLSSENSSDTSPEDDKNSDEFQEQSDQETQTHKDVLIKKKMTIAAKTKKKEAPRREKRSSPNLKSDKSTTEVKGQHAPVSPEDTSSCSGSKHESEKQMSSSESNPSSDSEGVVAVVSKTAKKKHSRIYVEVTSLTLWPDCGVLQDPMVELIFVDYHGFLGLPPDQLETPHSLPKTAPDSILNFNFRQEFSVDKKQYPSQVQALTEVMGGRGILKFTITSEPSEDMQDSHDCQDLGYAYVDLHQMAREKKDLLDGVLAVESAEDGNQIGVLRVTLRIVKALEYLGLI